MLPRLIVAIGFLACLLASPVAAEGRRELVLEAMEYPWSAIGRVNAAGRGFCTGFLVAEDKVMTAAHCLYDFVRGRWLIADEIHFIAGYQRDRFILHARVASYVRSNNFKPLKKVTLDIVPRDWAILTLEKPIGRQAGWLPVAAPDAARMQRMERQGGLFVAGYHAARAHAQSLRLGCRLTTRYHHDRAIVHNCGASEGMSGAPLLTLRGGQLTAIGVHSIEFARDGHQQAGVFSMAGFTSMGSDARARAAFQGANIAWHGGRGPAEGSPAARAPRHTIDQLLIREGLLPRASTLPVGEATRHAALQRFGATVKASSLAALAALLAAVE